MLAAPGAGSNEHMLQEAVTAAAKRDLVQPHDHVVCVMSIKDSLVVKVVTLDSIGARCMRHTDSTQGGPLVQFSLHICACLSQTLSLCTGV